MLDSGLKISRLDRPAYIYNIRPDSVSQTITLNKIKSIVFVFNERYKAFLRFSDKICFDIDSFYNDLLNQIIYLRFLISKHLASAEKKTGLKKLYSLPFISQVFINSRIKKCKCFIYKLIFIIIKYEIKRFNRINGN